VTDRVPAPPLPPVPGAPPDGDAPAGSGRTAALRGARDDLRPALLTVLALTLSGLLAGGLWLWLAPRAQYRVTATGPEPVGAAPSPELFMSDDGVFVLIMAGLGLLAGIAVWLHRRRRGALTLLALATGMLAAGVVAWQLGEWLGRGPTHQQLSDVGTTVTTGLRLGASAALAVGPFVAVLVYLVAASLTPDDDLGRRDGAGPVAERPPGLPLPPVPPPNRGG
jgi:hypothetical protein